MYWITFTEEFIMVEGYEGWIAGRMQIYNFEEDPSYPIDEKRFFTPHREEFLKFRWAFEMTHLPEMYLKQIERKLEEFNQPNK